MAGEMRDDGQRPSWRVMAPIRVRQWLQDVWRYRVPKLPYPLRATRLSLDFQPFGFWWKPTFTHRRRLTEAARADGETIWWARWAWFQISYGRWL